MIEHEIAETQIFCKDVNKRLNSHFFLRRIIEGCNYVCVDCGSKRTRKKYREVIYFKSENGVGRREEDAFYYCPKCGLASKFYERVIKEESIMG